MLNAEQAELIKNYITEDEPFGPVDAKEIGETLAQRILFDSHNKIYKELHQRPSIVIGRKGSGKTSYLHAAYFEKNYDYIVEINTPDAFIQIIRAVEQMSKGTWFAEAIAQLWETVLWIGLFSEIRSSLSMDTKRSVNAYLSKIGIRDNSSIDDVLWTIADVIAEKASGKTIGIIADILRRTDDISYAEVKDLVCDELRRRKQRAVIMLDSMDEFHLQIESVSLALQGLLKCIGDSNMPSARTDIRFCLPSELYHRFQTVSSNPNKDFRRQLTLHWIAPELMLIAANRLLLFFEIYKPHLRDKFDKSCIQDRGEANRLFSSVFPKTITSGLGIEETPLAYLYRHTQLLPRHFLILLNSICHQNKRFFTNDDCKIDEESIRLGVSSIEERIVREIFVAYRATYPSANTVCEQCIPELQHVFSIGDLERVFRTHGKTAMATDDFFAFKRMLVEIGAIGRAVDDSGKYVQALFEYTLPHQLVSSTDDDLCLHPLFTEIFGAKTKTKKPVYPYGSSMEDSDYRDW